MALRLGEQLAADGVISEEQLQQGLQMQTQLGGRLGTNLIELGALSEARLLEALGQHRGSRTANRRQLEGIPSSVIRLLSPKMAKRYQLVPYELQGKTLLIASADVVDAITEDEIRMLTGHMVRTAVSLELRVKIALQRYYRVPSGVRFGSLAKRLESGTLVAATPRVARTQVPEPEPVAAPPPRFAPSTPRPTIPSRPEIRPETPTSSQSSPGTGKAPPPRFARNRPAPPIPPLPQTVEEAPASPPPPRTGDGRPLRSLEPVSAIIPLPELDEHGRPKLPKIQPKRPVRPMFIELDDDDAELLRSMRDSEEGDLQEGEETPPATQSTQSEVQRRPFWERPAAGPPGTDTGTEAAAKDAAAKDGRNVADSQETTGPQGSTGPQESTGLQESTGPQETTEPQAADAQEAADGPPATAPTSSTTQAQPEPSEEDAWETSDDTSPVFLEEAFEEPRLDDPELSLEERLNLASDLLQGVEIRDEIADVLLDFAAPFFERRLLLFRRQKRILGWRGDGAGVVNGAVRAVEIGLGEPSVFLSLTETSSFWMASLPPLEPNQRLVAGLGGASPKDCLVLPVVVRSKVVCYFYGDNRQAGVGGAPLAEIRRLMAKAGLAFEVYILKNKMRLL